MFGQRGSPVIVAPMAGGVSTPALVAACAAAGAFGFLGAGYQGVDQLAADMAEAATSTDQFGVNLFVPGPASDDRKAVLAYRELLLPIAEAVGVDLPLPRGVDDHGWDAKVDLLLSQPAPWVSFTFGVPPAGVLSALRRAGSRVAITVTSPDEARRATATDVDALIVQSHEAGGHRGTFDATSPGGREPLTALLGAIGHVAPVPLIAAGGTGDHLDVRRALDAGACAVQVGTAFLLTPEAGTGTVHRAVMREGRYARTAVTAAFTGRPARGLANDFATRFGAAAPAAYPAVHHLTAGLRTAYARRSDPDAISLWAGTRFTHARVETTASVVARLSQ
jgi:nitronate monooxygenase